MPPISYSILTQKSLNGEVLSTSQSKSILVDETIELLPLLQAAFEVRKKHWGKDVTIHIINNTQNGSCPEDCNYCAQASSSNADIEVYAMKPEAEILKEAEAAHQSGAHRYCMVLSGRGPRQKRVEHLAKIIKKIKQTTPIEVCLSAGLINKENAKTLKAAGLDRLNHNLNTSERIYPSVCTTHTYQDRVNTLLAAQSAGIQLCSGVIVGMGEKPEDLIEVATHLRSLNAESIPVNFLIPIPGNKLYSAETLSPEYCLRVLCLFRFLNPKAEIRVAAGREHHLRSMEPLSLYPANSLFLNGYLNTKGAEDTQALQMIKDAGFTIRSQFSIDALLKKSANQASSTQMKAKQDLRPALTEN